VAFDPRTGQLASGGLDGVVRLFDPRTRRQVSSFSTSAAVHCLAYRPDGLLLVAGLGKRQAGDATEVRVRHLDTGKDSTLRGHSAPVIAVAFSPDGKFLATASSRGVIRLWDGARLRLLAVLSGHPEAVNDLEFSPDGKLLASAGQDGTLRLWAVPGGALRKTIEGPGGMPLFAVAFTPDGARLVTAGAAGRIVVWDAQDGEEKQALTGHTGAVQALAFGPGGRLASAGSDGSVRLWDLREADGHEVLAIRGHRQVVHALAFSRDGRFLATGGKDRTVLLHEAPP
jgi:WD40 repeat protein